MPEKFDVVVVGGGLAGLTAAFVAARAGLEVVLAERGVRPGSKTVSGGLLYTHALAQLFPRFWEEEPSPVERAIDRNVLSFLTAERAASIDYFDSAFARPPFNSFSVLRSNLDPWLAAKAEAAGMTPVYGVKVDTLLREGGRVVGIRADQDELRAEVTILAEGANANLSRGAGQQPEGDPGLTGVGVKQVIGLPPGEVARRFQLAGRSGTQYSTIGFPPGIQGGGFLYTNRESISVGLILTLRSLVEANVSMSEVLEQYKQHPFLARLVEGGQLLEYSGCYVAEGGYDRMAPLFADGVLLAGAAAGLFLNNGFTLRGMDFAIESGRLAGEAAVRAARAHDSSAKALAVYRQELGRSFVLRELAQFRRYPAFFENARLYSTYPALCNEPLHQLFRVEGGGRPHLGRLLFDLTRGSASPVALLRDVARAARTL